MRICYREFRVLWDEREEAPVLYSMWINFPWTSGTVKADQLPERELQPLGQLHGIHGVLPSARNQVMLTSPQATGPKVLAHGAVDTSGRIVEHDDGVVRAEHARILALRLIVVPGSYDCGHGLVVGSANLVPGRHYVVGVCTCWIKGEESAFMYGVEASAISESLVRGVCAVRDFEDLLLAWYEVPPLPMGVGRWRSPWGGKAPL